MEIDAGKSTLVVTGDADPIDIIIQTRKKCNNEKPKSDGGECSTMTRFRDETVFDESAGAT
ncbi:hypothetical protein QJS10_CPB11g00062 [Acorus calamus]|uniref:Uncharacterized protein n=1 Tax=Acorus calamus TaxID=4465 RepID=A0AAV9DU50_ACOCL|nr:hypothetical protein QJS10_CPB11g00062 [Acorus calamus]